MMISRNKNKEFAAVMTKKLGISALSLLALCTALFGCGGQAPSWEKTQNKPHKTLFMQKLNKHIKTIEQKAHLSSKQIQALMELKKAAKRYIVRTKRNRTLWVMEASSDFAKSGTFQNADISTEAFFREEKIELDILLHKFKAFHYILDGAQKEAATFALDRLLKSILFLSVSSYPKMQPLGLDVTKTGLIKKVFSGFPAEKSGLLPGDKIKSINGIPVTLSSNISRLADISGSDVSLQVERRGENKIFNLQRKFVGE